MAKKCPECHTVTTDDAQYCRSCECQFSRAPAKHVTPGWIWQYLAVLVVIAAIVAAYLFYRAF